MQPKSVLLNLKLRGEGRGPPGGYPVIYTYSATHGVFQKSHTQRRTHKLILITLCYNCYNIITFYCSLYD